MIDLPDNETRNRNRETCVVSDWKNILLPACVAYYIQNFFKSPYAVGAELFQKSIPAF